MLNVEIAPEQISTSHRLKSKKKGNSDDDTRPSSTPIIARFVNRDIRNRLYSNRKLARDLDLKSFSVKDTQHIYINENLTHVLRSENVARTMRRSLNEETKNGS